MESNPRFSPGEICKFGLAKATKEANIADIYSTCFGGGNRTATPKRPLIVKLGTKCYDFVRLVTWLQENGVKWSVRDYQYAMLRAAFTSSCYSLILLVEG